MLRVLRSLVAQGAAAVSWVPLLPFLTCFFLHVRKVIRHILSDVVFLMSYSHTYQKAVILLKMS